MKLLERLARAFRRDRNAEEEAADRAAFPAQVAQVLRTVPGVVSAEPSAEIGVRVAIAQGLTYEIALKEPWKSLRARPPEDEEAWIRGCLVACLETTPQLDMIAFEEFEASVEQVPWFENLGKPLEPEVPRLQSFEDWAGPYTDEVDAIDLSGLRYAVQGTGPELDAWHPLAALFHRVKVPVHEACVRKLGDDPPDADPEVPPRFAAASMASWTAALVSLHLACRRELPPELAALWGWFRRGHWPAEAVFDEENETVLKHRVY